MKPIPTHSQIKPIPQYTNGYLLISGELFLGYTDHFGTEIELNHNNEIIQKYICCSNGYFYFRLEYEMIYTLNIHNSDYNSKSLIIDTRINMSERKKREYEFGVTLNKKTDSLNIPSNNQPVAYIRFNEKMKVFEHDLNYLKNFISQFKLNSAA